MSARLSALEAEIQDVEEQIEILTALRQSLLEEKQIIVRQNETTIGTPSNGRMTGKAKATAINYAIDFDWDPQLKRTMKDVFGIPDFRLCQQGVCNANMDGRDIVCVMPTGGGKSLTYQLPALLMPGCTLVISPLVALITDQILHLHEAGVNAVMLTGGTSKAQAQEIQQRLTSMAASRRGPQQKEIKLCYVTPEKIAKSKSFMSLLQKLVEGGKLARVVIDEAHCVSQLGHDFRPDYKRLGVLRQFFPHVPILALSATCPPKVLHDILKILHMKPAVDGQAAPKDGTVYFSAPLYRKNLHYAVIPKPSSAKTMISVMSDYILEKHKNASGIIYCLSKKDAETVAISLQETSNGQIRTGVYHADVPDSHKEDLHRRWRDGSVQVVCATIAFGLGIDKGNVRFVLHHTMSKSLDGYYQESGRAGRDGKDADCILYYRPQDASRQAGITCSDPDGKEKLHDMLRFAQDMQECRKILFAEYFSASSDLSMTSWATEESGATDRCGHCDNCTRPAGEAVHKDVTLEAWQTLKILEAVHVEGGRQTIAGLSDLARGLAGGSFETGGKRKRGKDKAQLDYDAVCGGKVAMSKPDLETLIVHLLLTHYLGEFYADTAYTVNAYVIPGERAVRLTRLSREEVLAGKEPRVSCSFKVQQRKSAVDATTGEKRKKPASAPAQASTSAVAGPSRVLRAPTVKRKRSYDYVDVVEGSEEEEVEVDQIVGRSMYVANDEVASDVESSEDDEDNDWMYSLRATTSTKKRRGARMVPANAFVKKRVNEQIEEEDVIELSSD